MNITITKILKLWAVLPFFLSCCVFKAFSQPNFVIIIADDQGWTGSSVQMDNSILGSKSDYYFTPEMESLAQTGMTFSQAYSPAPKCSPSRCSILTGRTTARNGFTNTDNLIAADQLLIEPTSNTSLNGVDTTLAEWLKSIGMDYRTAHFGKWHLGSAASSNPSNNGFDFNDGSTNNGDGNHGGGAQPDPKNIFDLTDRSVAFIQNAVTDGVPFFLQLSHYAVHAEVEARQATIDLYNDPAQRPPGIIHTGAEYGAMTEDMDTGIGQLLAEITNLGLDNNTYVILMSDNGGQVNVTDNTPLFRGKTFIYEGGIRVPFIIKGPNITSNSYSTEPIIEYDLFPTIAELTGSVAALPANMDGQSLAPLFTGSTFSRTEPLYFHSPHYDTNPNKTPRSALVDGHYKLIVEYETGNTFLYDLSTDIGENNDLSSSEPVLVLDLCVKLRDHLKSVKASMPTLDPSHPNFSGAAPDIDDDGLEDEWEFRELLSYTFGPNDDPDGDGLNNLLEFNNGTDPYVAETVLALNENAFFEAKITPDAKVRLFWFAMENGEVDFIEIERSLNGWHWNAIGNVKAGVSSFIDAHPLEGLAYYRLKVVNMEGVEDFSTLACIRFNTVELVHIFPNPVAEILHLQFNKMNTLPVGFELRVYDDLGRLVRMFEETISMVVSFPLEGLPPGIYFAQVNLGINPATIPAFRFLVE